MRFSIALVATTLTAMALASPCSNNLAVRGDQSANTSLVLSVNGGTLTPDISIHCITSCGGVLLEAACIASAIAVDQPELVLSCIEASDWKHVCSCANCIPGLSSFLHKHGHCK